MNSENNLLAAGTVLQNRYKIEKILGRGGWGAVYKASYISPELARLFGHCAIKEMKPSPHIVISQEKLLQMFSGEAQTLVQLKHEHIPRITDYFKEQDSYYLVMEHIEGKDLETLIEENNFRSFPEEKVFQWAIEICQVLDYLHTRKPAPYIFRDLKPANIMIDRNGKITLVDFGITWLFQQEDKEKLRIGTPGYSPPEQYEGREDPRSDIYALGVTLHCLLTGRDPSKEKKFSFQDVPVSRLNSAVSPEGEAIISRAVQNDINKRYQSSGEMLQDMTDMFWKNISSSRSENFTWIETTRQSTAKAPAFTKKLDFKDLKVPSKEEDFKGEKTKREIFFAPLDKDIFKETDLCDPEWFDLRMKAERLSLTSGFNRLISLSSIEVIPYNHQKKAALDALRIMRGRVLLSDEVGLGKTIEAGLIIKELLLRGLAKKILILVPASLTTQWKEEMNLHFQEEFYIQNNKKDWEEHNKLIASIDTARRDEHTEIITKIIYDLLIIDEAHKLKNRTSKGWKLVNKISKRYILMLTATPVQNDLEELFNLITLLKPGQLKNLREFRKNFIDSSDKRTPVNTEELKKLIRDVMIRNRRSSVDVYLPPRRAGIYYLRESLTERKFRMEFTQFIRNYYRKNKEAKGLSLHLIQMQKALGSSTGAVLDMMKHWKDKMEPLSEEYNKLTELCHMGEEAGENRKALALLEILKRTSDKVIVFTEFLITQNYLRNLLENNGYRVALFNGEMSIKEKDEQLLYFKADGQVLISTQSGSEGKNLQFCHIMVNYDLPWNPMRLEQRIGRIHRLTQERDVLVFNLSLLDTFEGYILYLLSEKIRMFELVIGELDLILGDFESDETFEKCLQRIWLTSDSDEEMKKEIDRLGNKLIEARKNFQNSMDTDMNISALFEA
jgi:serine/threonine protein kinase